MPRVRGLFLLVLVLPVLLHLDSGESPGSELRRRIEAARETAKQRAEMALAARPAQGAPLWPIVRHHIPRHTVAGVGSDPANHSRFFAECPADLSASSQDRSGTPWIGTRVFFYQRSGGALHLAGQGTIEKLRRERGRNLVEARILTSRWTVPAPATGWIFGLRLRSPFATVPVLRRGLEPDPKSWFMSPDLLGPDTEGWTLEQQQFFAMGQAWVGMTDWALDSLLGPPTWQSRLGEEEARVYGDGPRTLGIRLREGRVVAFEKREGDGIPASPRDDDPAHITDWPAPGPAPLGP